MADSIAKRAAKAKEAARVERYPRVEMIELKGKTVGAKTARASEKTKKIVREAANGKPSVGKKIEEFFNGPKKLTPKQERKANAMQVRRTLDTKRTAARATAIEKRNAKKKGK